MGKLAVIDFETTGLETKLDEVLQVAIIDENCNVLIDTYCKTLYAREWPEAMRVNKITPLMVACELPFASYVPKVAEILFNAETIIAYNADFERGFLDAYGIKTPAEKWADPMIMFARYIGEWDEKRKDHKRHSLVKCADYFGYKFNPHNALEDVEATLYCYNKLKAIERAQK